MSDSNEDFILIDDCIFFELPEEFEEKLKEFEED